MYLKSLLLGTLTSLALPTLTASKPVHSTCITQTALFGFKDDEEGRLNGVTLQGDLEKVGELSLMKLAYSRPKTITVCANDDYIHSMQIGLQLYPLTRSDY